MTDGVLDASLRRVQVSGKVTLKGAAMPTATASRGTLTFSLPGGGGAASTASFGTTGNVTYGLSLWPGTNDVLLGANAALCTGVAPAPALPCTGEWCACRSLTTDGVLDVDVPAVTVSGTVTFNGAALPTETLTRGSVGIGRVSAEGGAGVSFSLGTTSAATYTATLMPGSLSVPSRGERRALRIGAAAPDSAVRVASRRRMSAMTISN